MIDLSAIADEDCTLLTVNNRLATELRARFDQAQHAAGREVWASADFLPWDAWLSRGYERLLDAGLTGYDLLNGTQEKLLWQSIIERHPRTTQLLRPGAAAQCAQTSARLYADWHLDQHPIAALGGDETACFLDWKHAFERELDRRGQMTRAQLLPTLTAAIATHRISMPKRLLHAGFETLSPAQQALFRALRDAGCEIDAVEESGPSGHGTRIVANDTESEIRMAALWADRQTARDATRRVAVIVPQIAQLKDAIDRIFTATLAPATYRLQAGRQARFNISLGEPLADRPLVDAALAMFEILHGEHPLSLFGQLLRSPFLGGHNAEWSPRALLDVALRNDGLPRIDLRRLRYRASQYAAGDARHCRQLVERIDAVLALLDQLAAVDTPNAWAGHLQKLLTAFGWPGDSPLDSHEFQQHERLQRAFSELATLGKVCARIRLGEAVQWLRSIVQEALFQPQSPPSAIQILGPLEAAGMRFDAIWLLGMHDRAWPPPPHPDPLLPAGLQRELGMPHASAERELAFASALTARMLRTSPHVTASHACFDADQELRPSPLIADWSATDTAVLNTEGPPQPQVGLEAMPHVDATPARTDQAGGAGLLAAQAACPFKAVAQYRLRAAPLAEPVFAADGAMLGTMVHELLQRVWQELGDSQRLAASDEKQLQQLIAPLAQAVLDDIGRRRPDLFTPRFRAIEAGRLGTLVTDWLAIERQRTQPFRVAALERQQTIEIEGLSLETRADRVDELEDGSLAIVDYKTGRTVTSDGWFDERLSEPQLPLYSLHTDAPVSAALLARVRNDPQGCRFVGLSERAEFAPGVRSTDETSLDWPGTQAHWQRALATLAREVVDGRADPTPSPQACEYCSFAALCRLPQLTVGGSDD